MWRWTWQKAVRDINSRPITAIAESQATVPGSPVFDPRQQRASGYSARTACSFGFVDGLSFSRIA
jgi:hypothetical protein